MQTPNPKTMTRKSGRLVDRLADSGRNVVGQSPIESGRPRREHLEIDRVHPTSDRHENVFLDRTSEPADSCTFEARERCGRILSRRRWFR